MVLRLRGAQPEFQHETYVNDRKSKYHRAGIIVSGEANPSFASSFSMTHERTCVAKHVVTPSPRSSIQHITHQYQDQV